MDLATMEHQAILLGKSKPRELPRSVIEALAYSGLMRFLDLPQPENVDSHTNFAYSTILTAPSPASSGTSLVVASGDGAKFPTVPFNAVVWPTATQPSTTNAEVIRVTARSTDTLTIVRTQEGSNARTIIVGDQIAATVTAKTLTDVETAVTLVPGNVAGSMPNGAIASTLARSQLTQSSQTLTSGTLYMYGVTLGTGVVLTSITFLSNTVALASGTHQLFGVFDDSLGSSSGTAYALLRGTSDDTSIAWAASTAKTLNLTSTYTTTRSGFFYLGILVVATTTPNLTGFGPSAAASNLPSVSGGATTKTGLTALPNPANVPATPASAYAYVS